jgi:tRNA (guanosine-2'-O-)-methyltransferase
MDQEKFEALTMWTRNVQDHLKPLTNEQIIQKLEEQSLPFSVMMSHINGDFNISSVIRSANGFGAKEVFYYGKKHYDRRGCVGSHSYLDVSYLKTFEDIVALKEIYTFVGLENNINRICHNVNNFSWNFNKPTLIILGEESKGLTDDILDLCDHLIYIDMSRGSVRSFNAAVAASVAMFDYVSKYEKNKGERNESSRTASNPSC